jgi:peptidoglycan/LPS O-acetylase OafA/YrhL
VTCSLSACFPKTIPPSTSVNPPAKAQSAASQTPRNASSAGNRIPSLDGLRALSILLVIISHTAGTRNAFSQASIHFLGDIGNLGVRVFFVISGFLITTLLLHELEKRGSISLRWFYFRRTMRIFPASYVYTVALWLAGVLGWVTLGHYDVLAAFTYTQNYFSARSWWFGHLWSLSVEEQFYLVWPATLALLGRAGGLRVAVGILALSPILRIMVWQLLPGWRELIDTAFPTIADPLAIGCVLALMRKQMEATGWYMRLISSSMLGLLPLLAIVINAPLSDRPRISYAVGQSILNVILVLMVHHAVWMPQAPLGRILNWRPLQVMGVLSYSLYLWQQPFLNRELTDVLHVFPNNVALAVAAGVASYYLVEAPSLRLRSRLEASLHKRPDSKPVNA